MYKHTITLSIVQNLRSSTILTHHLSDQNIYLTFSPAKTLCLALSPAKNKWSVTGRRRPAANPTHQQHAQKNPHEP